LIDQFDENKLPDLSQPEARKAHIDLFQRYRQRWDGTLLIQLVNLLNQDRDLRALRFFSGTFDLVEDGFVVGLSSIKVTTDKLAELGSIEFAIGLYGFPTTGAAAIRGLDGIFDVEKSTRESLLILTKPLVIQLFGSAIKKAEVPGWT
jgi:hypothetical protein